MLNPWILLAIVLSWGIATATGWKLRGDHEAAVKLDQALAYAEAIVEEQNRVTAVSDKSEKELADARVSARTREAKLREELKNAQYATCVLPDFGRVLFNSAVRDANSAASGKPVESVPSAGATGSAGNDGRPTARVDGKHGLVP